MNRRHPRAKRLAAALFGAAFGLGAAGQAAAAAWEPNEDDSLVLELRSGQYRLGDSLRGYQTGKGVCVDMVDLVQALNLPVRLDRKSRRATGWIFAEDETFVLDRDSLTVQTVNERQPLRDGDLHDTPEGWCAELGALSKWFGVNFRADLANMAVVIETDRKLPFLEAIERKSRAARLQNRVASFDLAQLPRADMPYKTWRTPAVDVMVNTAWRSTRGAGSQIDARYEAYASGEVMGASFDARLTSDGNAMPETLRVRAYRVDPEGGLLGPLRATQVAVGDVETFAGALTGQSAVGRGVFITNRPVTRSSRFAVTTLRGELPAGWDAELYRNGQLLAFQASRADGRYEFPDVELRFGANDFEVVLYGPQGQVRRDATSYPVGNASLPAGQTLYWAGIVDQDRNLIDFRRKFADPLTGWRWGVGVERGIDKSTTVGLGLQSLVLKGRRRNYAELTLRRALGPLLVELAGAQEFGHGSGRVFQGQALGRIGRFNLRAEALWVDGGYESEVVSAEESRVFGFSTDTDLAIGGKRFPVQAGWRQTVARNGTKVNEWLLRSSLPLRGMAITAELVQRQSSGPKADRLNDGLRLNLLANTRIGGLRLRGNARFRLNGREKGLDTAELVAERALTARSDVRGSVGYQAGSRTFDFGLGYVRQFRRFALRGDATVSSRGNVGLGLSLAMSFGPDPVRGGWRASANKLAQFGEAAVTVYRDENGDGRRQNGEDAVEGVEIATGHGLEQARTDASGTTVIDGLRPFTQVLVAIDESSVEDPLLFPKGKGVVLVPRPGVMAKIELPLAPTGEVEASLLGIDGEPREGVTIELIDARGQVQQRAQTEFDGYVLFDRVPYGEYRLRLTAASAAALGARTDLGVGARIDRARPSARLGTLRIEPDNAPPGGTIAR